MDLEALRLRFETQFGPAIQGFKQLEKQLRAQSSAIRATAAASKEYKTEAQKQAAVLGAWASQLRVFNVGAEAQAKVLKAVEAQAKKTEQAKRRMVTATNATAEAAERGTAGFTKFTKAVAAMGTAVFLANRLSAAFKAVFSVVEDAARTQAAKRYFDDAGKSLDRLREASRGLVSDANLIKKANLADSMGLSNSTFETLIQVAEAASTKTGQSFDRMFDSITLGTARSSRLLLDNLGIIVSIDAANRNFAKQAIKDYKLKGRSINQVVNSLTDEAKKVAFLNELHKATKGQMEQFNRLGTGGAAVFDRWAATVENLKTALGTKLLPVLTAVLARLTSLLNKVTEALSVNPLEGMRRVQTGGGFAQEAYTFAGVQVRATDIVGRDRPEAEVIEEFKAKVRALADELGGADLVVSSLKQDGTLPLIEEFNSVTGTMERLDVAANDSIDLFNALNQRFRVFVSDGTKNLGRGDILEPPSGAGKAERDPWFDEFAKRWDALEKRAVEHAENMLRTQLDFFNSLEDETRRILDFSFQTRLTGRSWMDGVDGGSWSDGRAGTMLAGSEGYEFSAAEIKAMAKEYHNALVNNLAHDIGLAQGVVSGDTSALVSSVATGIGAALGAPQLGAAIGDLLGPFMSGLEGLDEIAKALFKGFGELISRGLGPLLNTLEPLGQAFYSLLAAVGTLIGAALRPLIPLLNAVVPILVVVINFFVGLIVALSPLVEVIATIAYAFLSLGATFGLAFVPLEAFASGVAWISGVIIDIGVGFNNAMVSVIRKLPGLGDWGNADLSRSDFMPDWGSFTGNPPDDLPLNTDATRENTEAIRDLSREIHNMPAGYKTGAAIWAASDPEAAPGGGRARPKNPAGIFDPRRRRDWY